jgi:hypothetical protein
MRNGKRRQNTYVFEGERERERESKRSFKVEKC